MSHRTVPGQRKRILSRRGPTLETSHENVGQQRYALRAREYSRSAAGDSPRAEMKTYDGNDRQEAAHEVPSTPRPNSVNSRLVKLQVMRPGPHMAPHDF